MEERLRRFVGALLTRLEHNLCWQIHVLSLSLSLSLAFARPAPHLISRMNLLWGFFAATITESNVFPAQI